MEKTTKHVDFNDLTAFEATAIGCVGVMSIIAGVAYSMLFMTL